MRAWIHAHAEAAALTVRRFLAQPVGTLLSIAVIGIGLLFPLSGFVALSNIKALVGGVSTDTQWLVMLRPDVTPGDRADFEQKFARARPVKAMRFVSRDSALKELGERIGGTDLLAGLRANPLPDAYVLTIGESVDAEQTALADALRGTQIVDSVDVDAAWARRLRLLVKTGELIVLGVGLALALAMLAICFNTIRLQVLTRTEEMTVLRLFGATAAQIRRPFLYFGAAQGLGAALLAWGTVAGFVIWIEPRLGELFQQYGLTGKLIGLSGSDGLSLLAFSTLVGALGAWLAAREH
ncbi:MAG: ABC transporter permease [Casimicrobiaceae bacterium]